MPVANAALLAQVTDGAVAAEVQRQLLASGLPGAESAWTTAASVAHEGAVWRLALWLPTGEAGTSRYDAAFDASVGLLELSPAAEGAL